MRYLFLIFTIFLTTVLIGQTTFSFYCDPAINPDTSVSVKRIETNDKIIIGKIDDKYDITIYVKFFKVYCRDIYSVKGYYYYNKIKINIPLVGIYHNGELTLYQFNSKAKENLILNFELRDDKFYFSPIGLFEHIDQYDSLTGYEEKFEFNEEGKSWIKNGKTYKLTTSTHSEILKIVEYLYIYSNGNLKIINLHDLQSEEFGFDLINFSNDNNNTKFLFKTKIQEKGSVTASGMCYWNDNEGFSILTFDKEYNLIKHTGFELEHCYDGQTFEEIKSQIPFERIFILSDSKWNQNTSTVTLNLKKIKFTTVTESE